jgi:hypothetical protein
MVNMGNNGKVSDPFCRVVAQINAIFFAVLTRMRAKTMAQTKMVVVQSGI